MLDIHGFIKFSEKSKKIIDTPLFQRLGNVKQLTSSHFVFPGAQHTRKSHSIGAMHIAHKYMMAIFNHPNNLKLSEDRRNEVRESVEIAALLHDVAHGPYSHSFDATVYEEIYKGKHKGHDAHRHFLLKYFSEYCDTNKIADIWNNKYPHLSAIVQGVCGCDRLDFLKRDEYFLSSNYGCFDIDRIINNCWFENINNSLVLVYDSKIVKSVIQGLYTRLYMYEEIYLHRTVIAASVLIEMMILEASKYIDYISVVKDVEKFIYLNDNSLFYEILFSTSNELSLARKYAKYLYERKFPKMINEVKILNKDEKEGIFVIDETHIKWVSRSLSKDFIKEFEKHNINIRKGEKTTTFREYIKNENIEISEDRYHFERIYSFDY